MLKKKGKKKCEELKKGEPLLKHSERCKSDHPDIQIC
jgi:hypothetical protein